jgi:hypothetical protein
MSNIVRRTRVAAWIARRRLARWYAEAVHASRRTGRTETPAPEWFRFPPL